MKILIHILMDYDFIIQAFWIILPAYIANASALLFGGGIPIDFGKKWRDGKRILGDGKTWGGLFIGTFVGMIAGFGFSAVSKCALNINFPIRLNDFLGFPLMIPVLFSICFGALIGDIIESFFKRRRGKKRGENWIPFDQIDFILGVLFLSFIMGSILQIMNLTDGNWFFDSFSIYHIFILLVVTPFIHLFANFIHDKTKKV
jgi:CDP-2,3-bis-(O-geranylgeranyl)-sn-glycerol synthase